LLRISRLRHDFPFSPLTLGRANDLGGADSVAAICQGDADLDFGNLAVWVSRSDTLLKGLEAPYLCLDPASGVISGPALPERPAMVPGGTQGIVSRNRRRAVLFPQPPVPADRDDRRGLAVDDGRMAAAGVIMACSCSLSDRMDSPCEWSTVRVMHQRPSKPIPAECGVEGFFFRYERHFVYWRHLLNGDIGIVTILHERMHQIDRFRDDFGLG